MPKKEKEWLEAVYVIDRLEGAKIGGMLGIFYNPFSKKFEDYPSIKETFLIFEHELMEYSKLVWLGIWVLNGAGVAKGR